MGTNNLIRVVVEEEALRGYIYQFLSSQFGQDQLKMNIYGAIVDHIEPDQVRDVLVPVPTVKAKLEEIGLPVIRPIEHQERAYGEMESARKALDGAVGGVGLKRRSSESKSSPSVGCRKTATIFRGC